MMGSLPMGKHVVCDIDGASRESDTAIECEMEKHFNHLLLGKADVQGRTDVAAQRAFPSERRQAGHRAQTAAGQVEARTRPGGAPVVFARDAVKGPFRFGRWR